MAIAVSGVEVKMVQVNLRDKPQALLACSPKGTVPVLQLADGTVIDESLDIMRWALAINDPEEWMNGEDALSPEAFSLIQTNDNEFKKSLDRFKYADRFPENSRIYYREQAEVFITCLNTILSERLYLIGNKLRFVDVAIFPFIRQFAHVDKEWFYSSRYKHVIDWLDRILANAVFNAVMAKTCNQ